MKIDYSKMDQSIIEEFKGEHPKIIYDWIGDEDRVFLTDPNYKLTFKQKKHRIMILFEKFFGIDLSKKHYKLIR